MGETSDKVDSQWDSGGSLDPIGVLLDPKGTSRKDELFTKTCFVFASM